LADGRSDAAPLGEGADVPVWVAMPELRAAAAADCGLLSADRAGGHVRVRFACSSAESSKGREVEIKDGDRVVAKTKLPETALGEAAVAVTGDYGKELVAALTGKD